MMTATEVRMNLADWEENELPKLTAKANAFIDSCFAQLIRVMSEYMADQELQQQRMSDDGCPNE